jgi:TolB-like protein/class 3 adenylate cyclase
MGEDHAERRLAAVLAADVVGYSRMMGLDEEGTLRNLKIHREELIDPKITEHHGRLIKTTGDGLLVEFASVVNAVRCAKDIQRAMQMRNAGKPQEQRIEFRIGINVGDIIIERDDIFGDGVNVAARLEGIAQPGGICVSGRVQEDVEGKVDGVFEYQGEQKLKNITRPLRIYRMRLDEGAEAPHLALALPDKPSIAVLPFNNLSGDPEQEYFADGVVEDVITALSRLKWLFVIARNSSFTYKGKNVDVKQVARDLGVRYVLEGSVRKAGNKVRITGQLIDGANATHIWADTYDGILEDIFEFQDQITSNVVSAIEPTLQHAELERLKQKPTEKFDAYDLMLHALHYWHQFTDESFSAALRCLERALVIDPSYAPAMAMMAYCYAHRRQQGWAKNLEAEAQRGLHFASQAVELASDDGDVLWMAAAAVWQLQLDRQRARELARRSLAANSNSVWALIVAALIEMTSGHAAEGLELLRRADRLSPCDPTGWLLAGGVSLAHYLEGNYAESIRWSEKALAQNPKYVVAIRLLAANYAQIGKLEPAKEQIKKLLNGDPLLTISKQRSRMMFMDAIVWEKLAEGLRLAGLPE